jgi:putative ABC transport system permease protein
MIGNYIKTSLRNLTKHKGYSGINIVGLASGIAICLLIGKYIDFESSYDRFHVNGKNIYRVVSSFYTEGVKDEYDGYDLGPALAATFPQISSFTRTHRTGSLVTFAENGKTFKYSEHQILHVDDAFLEMFSFRLLRGNASTALRNGNSIIVTESIARKYFGEQDPLGKIIQLNDGWSPGLFEISAVIEDVPENSHFTFDFLLPMKTLLETDFYRGQHARWDNFFTYLQLRENTKIDELAASAPEFINIYRGDDKALDKNASLEFQNLLDIYYSPDLNNPGTRLTNIYLFAGIALFVLAIAWINYVNLATARAIERAREVGVKKAIGASRQQLVIQFLVESGIINLLSVFLAAGIAFTFLPVLNAITGRTFTLNFAEPAWLIVLAILFATGTLVSGVYPALLLSSFKTTEVIKGRIRAQTTGWSLRNGMVGFQFACSFLLLVATFVIFRQVNFMQDQDKEFTTKQTVVIKGPASVDTKADAERVASFRNELLQYPFVDKVATSFSVPGEQPAVSTGMRKATLPASETRIGNVYYVDPYFMDLYGIRLLSGRTWDPQLKTDLESVVINEEAVKTFQLGDNQSALRETIIWAFDTVRIIGVVKNHHWNSLKTPFMPMVFYAEKVSNTLSVQLNGNMHSALEVIEKKFKSKFADTEFNYYFVDDFYRAQYHEEEVFGKLFTVFSALAIVIGCLGLWGLAAFTTLRRQKEISIRKTLGASVYSVIILLVSQFLRPLLIAGIVVLPLAWMGGEGWLEKFPYRMHFSIDILLIPFGLLLGVALATVSYQTLKVSLSNPVKALKSE